jgi:hypothetical protein
VSPIKGLTDGPAVFPLIGTIRKGSAKNERGQMGRDLGNHFRFAPQDPSDQELIRLFNDAFPQTENGRPQQIRFFFPFRSADLNFISWREEWTATVLKHQCDGEVCTRWWDQKTKRMRFDAIPCPYAEFEDDDDRKLCSPRGDLMMIVPALGRLATVRFRTTSIYDIRDIARMAAVVELLSTNAGIPMSRVPMVLSRYETQIKYPKDDSPTGKALRKAWLASIHAEAEWQSGIVAALTTPVNPAQIALPAMRVREDGSMVSHDGEVIEGRALPAPPAQVAPAPAAPPRQAAPAKAAPAPAARVAPQPAAQPAPAQARPTQAAKPAPAPAARPAPAAQPAQTPAPAAPVAQPAEAPPAEPTPVSATPVEYPEQHELDSAPETDETPAETAPVAAPAPEPAPAPAPAQAAPEAAQPARPGASRDVIEASYRDLLREVERMSGMLGVDLVTDNMTLMLPANDNDLGRLLVRANQDFIAGLESWASANHVPAVSLPDRPERGASGREWAGYRRGLTAALETFWQARQAEDSEEGDEPDSAEDDVPLPEEPGAPDDEGIPF